MPEVTRRPPQPTANQLLVENLEKYVKLLGEHADESACLVELSRIIARYEEGRIPDLRATLRTAAIQFYSDHYLFTSYDVRALIMGLPCPATHGLYRHQRDRFRIHPLD